MSKEEISNFIDDSLAKTLQDLASQKDNPTIICKSKENNPNYFSIIYANEKFYEIFNISEYRLIGKNYDFLFDDLELDYSSEDQMEFIRLIKAVKDFHQCSIIVAIANHNIVGLDKVRFKVSFEPQGEKDAHGAHYAIFTFEKLTPDIEVQEEKNAEEKKASSNVLLRNLERTLRKERLLREVGNLIISDLSVEEISSRIAKILCGHLKAERCLIHDYREGRTTFVVEHHDSDSKAMLKNNKDQESLEILTRYINFQDSFYKKFGDKNKRSSISIIKNVVDDANFKSISDICKKFSIASQIVVSTSLNGKLSGGIYIHNSTERSWLEEEINLVETIADQFALALDRSNAIEKIMTTNHALMEKTLQLKEALSHEQDMRKMQNDFIALVSHEFKTPLQIIDSTRELLARKLLKTNPDETISRSLDRIKAGIKRMSSLIASTLNLARMESGESEIKLEKAWFNLKEFLLEIIERNSTLATNKNINIISRIDGLPENFNGDSKLLEHSFNNVISNAIKYSKNGSVVKIIAKSDKEKVMIRIIDEGMGIPQEDLENIGKKFFRAKNTLSVAGTGIGLYLTKHFVELHGGSLLIKSQTNVGTSVTITIPN